jgi:hypothetical protein
MKKLFFLASILVCSPWLRLSAESCINEGTILGKAAKDCITNASMPKDAFENRSSVWQKHPMPALPVETTFVDRCPKDSLGYCELTVAASVLKHYYYSKGSAAQGRKGGTSAGNPMSSGVWHDP